MKTQRPRENSLFSPLGSVENGLACRHEIGQKCQVLTVTNKVASKACVFSFLASLCIICPHSDRTVTCVGGSLWKRGKSGLSRFYSLFIFRIFWGQMKKGEGQVGGPFNTCHLQVLSMPKLSIGADTVQSPCFVYPPPSTVVCCPRDRAWLEWATVMITKGDLCKTGHINFPALGGCVTGLPLPGDSRQLTVPGERDYFSSMV